MSSARGLWLGCGIWAVVMTLLGADRYLTYHSGADLGEFVQTIASPLSGFGDTPEGGSHFLHHFSPILYLCVPLLALVHSPIVLIAIQAVAGALVAPPLFLIVRKRADARLALLVASVALFYPALAGVAFTDFHENGFAPAAIAWLAWAVDARRWRLAAGFVALALAVKEDEAIVLAILGAGFAWRAWRRGDGALARFAAGTAVAAVVTLAAYFGVVRPLVGGHDAWFALGYFGNDVPHPAGIGEVLGRISYLLEAFVPLCFVPLLSRRIFYVIPGLIEVLSSRWSITYTMGQHYAGVWTGEMLVAFAFTLTAIAASRGVRFAQRLAFAALAVCVLNLSLASPTHWRHYLAPLTAHDAVLDSFIAALPAGAPIGTFDEAYAHLGFDSAAQIGIAGSPRYTLLDRQYPSQEWREQIAPQVRESARRGTYRLLRAEDGVELYERRAPSP